MAMEFVKVAETGNLKPGTMMAVEVGGEPVLLANVDGEYYAVRNECSHQGVQLDDGFLEGEEVECALHGSRFNLKTGGVRLPPATQDIKCYKVKVEGNDILIRMM